MRFLNIAVLCFVTVLLGACRRDSPGSGNSGSSGSAAEGAQARAGGGDSASQQQPKPGSFFSRLWPSDGVGGFFSSKESKSQEPGAPAPAPSSFFARLWPSDGIAGFFGRKEKGGSDPSGQDSPQADQSKGDDSTGRADRSAEAAVGSQRAGSSKSRARFGSDYEELTARYERVFRKIIADFKKAANSSSSLEEFFEKAGPSLDRYDTARRNLRADYSRIAHIERATLNRDMATARARDKREGSLRNVREFLGEDKHREAERAGQVRGLQRVLDRAADEVGRVFRLRFHERLEGEVVTLRKRGSSPEETRLVRERMRRAIEHGFARATPDNRQRRRYAESWVGYFLRHRSEPVVARKELPGPGPEGDRVVLKPVRPDDPPTEEPAERREENTAPSQKKEVAEIRKSTELPRKESSRRTERKVPDPVLDCRNNSCNLEQYRRFLAALPRSCKGSSLPDVLIKDCFPDFVYLNLTTPARREIMNFIQFSGDNYFDRVRGLGYFEETCYKFRPVLELGDSMVRGSTSFTTDQKLRIQQGLERIRACR